MLALFVVGLALLSAGGALSRATAETTGPLSPPNADVSVRPTPLPTPIPTPTATPAPEPPPPQFVPAGWQIYRDHHFAVAFPAGWIAYEHDVQGTDGQVVSAAVTLTSPDGSQTVAIDEHEGLDATTIRRYCTQPGSSLTYAGLPMRTSSTAGTVRLFVFVARDSSDSNSGSASSAGGIAYTLLYNEENISEQVKWFYDSILATFRPEFSAQACQ
jgi:hypothetical protein